MVLDPEKLRGAGCTPPARCGGYVEYTEWWCSSGVIGVKVDRIIEVENDRELAEVIATANTNSIFINSDVDVEKCVELLREAVERHKGVIATPALENDPWPVSVIVAKHRRMVLWAFNL